MFASSKPERQVTALRRGLDVEATVVAVLAFVTVRADIQLIIVVAVPTFVGEAAAFVSAELSATTALNELDDLNARESEREAGYFRGDHLAIDALFYGHDVVAEVALDEAFRPCADLQRLELLLGNRLAGNVGDARGVVGLGPEDKSEEQPSEL